MAIIVKKPIISPESAPLYTSSLEKIRLIVGLGNPGSQYARQRHNIGFICLEKLAELYEASWQAKKGLQGQLAQLDLAGVRLLLLKPQTYVNLSGEAISLTARFYKLRREEITIVYDEVRLNFGTIEALSGQNHFGHNGLKSAQQHLGEHLQLIRVGIGPKQPPQAELTDFVLGDFTAPEKVLLPSITKEVCNLIGEAGSEAPKNQKRSILPPAKAH